MVWVVPGVWVVLVVRRWRRRVLLVLRVVGVMVVPGVWVVRVRRWVMGRRRRGGVVVMVGLVAR